MTHRVIDRYGGADDVMSLYQGSVVLWPTGQMTHRVIDRQGGAEGQMTHRVNDRQGGADEVMAL